MGRLRHVYRQHFLPRVIPVLFVLSSFSGLYLAPYLSAQLESGISLPAEAVISETEQVTDSILSIIQSYYVDAGRVSNAQLVEVALVSLAEAAPGLEIAREEREYLMSYGAKSVRVAAETRSYDGLLNTFLALGDAIESLGVTEKLALRTGSDESAGAYLLLRVTLTALDAHSAFLSPEEYLELRQGTEGAFGGLGVLVGMREELLTIIEPLPRSPAFRAGLAANDRIIDIDGQTTFGESLDTLVEHMRGDPGTEVDLRILREGQPSTLQYRLRREVITVDSVERVDRVEGDLAVLHATIESFSTRTSRELFYALRDFRRDHAGKLSGVILDLRSNPGGLLDQAVQVADLFLSEGSIVTTRGRRTETESADSGFDETEVPIVVLMNEDSASASEIVAGALQDQDRAIVIGQPSFGKGSVQTLFELPGDRALKLTIARYYTPAGQSIQNVGIAPDVWLQPVAATSLNHNAFGEYRYKSERYLRHHLGSEDRGSAQPAVHRYKGYYLRTDPSVDKEREDLEASLAMRLLAEVAKAGAATSEKQDASDWLQTADPVIRDTLQRHSQVVAARLEKELGVEWATDADSGRHLTLNLKPLGRETFRSYELVAIRWTVHNPSRTDADRVSVYVRSERHDVDTNEQLVGRIAAGASQSGVTKVRLPLTDERTLVSLHAGIAIDASPLPTVEESLLIPVVPRQEPALDITAQLDDLRSGGKVLRALEPGEQATVQVRITNQGSLSARDLSVELTNLAGSQISVASSRTQAVELSPGTSTDVSFVVRAGETVLTDELPLGVTVHAANLAIPRREGVAVKAVPSRSDRLGKSGVAH